MAHWARLNKQNIVVEVLVGDNNDPNGDEGYQWLLDNLGGTWVKTSYNSVAGKWRNPQTNQITDNPGFRKNYAGVGYTYDEQRDAFIPPKPYDSWILNEDTCRWDPPVPRPAFNSETQAAHIWNEETLSWQEIV